MKKQKHFVFVACLAALLVGSAVTAAELPTATPAEVGLSAEKLHEISRIMNGFVEHRNIAGGIVLVARHGKIVFHETFGLMDLETKEAMRRDTIFRIYSMSKALTSAAALILYDEGKLDLRAPVSDYLPEFKDLKVEKDGEEAPATQPLTVANLFTHTSGLTYPSEDPNDTVGQM